MNLSDTDQAPYSAPAPQTATVSDEAVQVALDKCEKVDWVQGLFGTGLSGREIIESALTAAIPYIALTASPCSVEVKKLEWQDIDGQSLAVPFDRALSYGILNITNGMGEYTWSLTVAGVFGSQYKTLEQAKAAAQADFEHRILSQIVTKPVDVAAVREQCAQIAENFTGKEHIAHDIKAGIFPSQSKVNVAIASAIRALSPAEPVDQSKADFNRGYVIACCNIVNLHDEPTIAHDALLELGVTKNEVIAMNLSEYDLDALKKIEDDRSASPYRPAAPTSKGGE